VRNTRVVTGVSGQVPVAVLVARQIIDAAVAHFKTILNRYTFLFELLRPVGTAQVEIEMNSCGRLGPVLQDFDTRKRARLLG